MAHLIRCQICDTSIEARTRSTKYCKSPDCLALVRKSYEKAYADRVARYCVDCNERLGSPKSTRCPDCARASRAAGPCSVDGCYSIAHARQLCSMHYARLGTGIPIDAPALRVHGVRGVSPCSVDGCTRKVNQVARMLCAMHYSRLMKFGDVGPPHPIKYVANPVGKSNGARSTWKNSEGYEWCWHGGKNRPVHQVVMEGVLGRPLSDRENVHHINGVRDDNRPENLELWVKPQPCGQRPSDLVEWVVAEYPELVEAALAGRQQLRLIAN